MPIKKKISTSFLFSSEVTSSEVTLLKGETVVVIGVSPRRGHLVVEKRNHTFHVPFHCMEMKQAINGIGL